MPIDYSNHDDVVQVYELDLQSDEDNRERVREIKHFLNKRDGQWEPDIIESTMGKPRFTFDMCNPVIDQIAGELEQMEVQMTVRPSGGQASKDNAEIFSGLIRNIQNMSGAKYIFGQQGREMIGAGYGCWEVVQEYSDMGDPFDQDLAIKEIDNPEDKVWFDSSSLRQVKDDAMHVFKVTGLLRREYDDRFPEGSGIGLGDDRREEVYDDKPEMINVGQIFYKKQVTKELVRMIDGSIYEVDDKFESVQKELAEQGITEEMRRKVQDYKVYSRLFDQHGWLNDAQETVFDFLPIIPIFANYKISEQKPIYWGATEKLIDLQRSYNYVESRKIEEVVLAPRQKILATPKMIKGFKEDYETLNTNANPVLPYNPDSGSRTGAPTQTAPAQVAPSLMQLSADIRNQFPVTAGLHSASMGMQQGRMSEGAIQSLQNKGDTSMVKYINAWLLGIEHTCKVLVRAIPRVYDGKRQVRVLGEDGSEEMVTLNDVVFDRETQKPVHLNDLSVGMYDVVCDVGPMFKNRQQETVDAMIELLPVVPMVGEIGADIIAQNITAPGMKELHERLRWFGIRNGSIPQDQLTDEEAQILQQEQIAAQQNPPEPDAATKIAEAELQKVQVDIQKTQMEGVLKQEELKLKQQQIILGQEQAEKDNILKEMQMLADQQRKRAEMQHKQQLEAIQIQNQTQEALANVARALKDLSGADVVITPGLGDAIESTTQEIVDTQKALNLPDTPDTV